MGQLCTQPRQHCMGRGTIVRLRNWADTRTARGRHTCCLRSLRHRTSTVREGTRGLRVKDQGEYAHCNSQLHMHVLYVPRGTASALWRERGRGHKGYSPHLLAVLQPEVLVAVARPGTPLKKNAHKDRNKRGQLGKAWWKGLG